MLDSSGGAAVSAAGVFRLVPHSLQNWASDRLSRPQSMAELPFLVNKLGNKRFTRVMILRVSGRDKPFMRDDVAGVSR